MDAKPTRVSPELSKATFGNHGNKIIMWELKPHLCKMDPKVRLTVSHSNNGK